MKFILGAMLGVAIGWWLHAWQFTALPAPVTAPTSVVVPEAVPLATDPAPSADTLFALLLSSGATDQALEFLAKAPQPEPFRQRLLMHIQSLLDSKQLDRADELLDRYLRREFRDVDALLLQATLFKAQGKIQAALTALFRLRSYEYRSAQLAENQRRIDRWVDEYQVQLRQQPAATQLQFWQFLAAQDAQRLDYVVQMAALSIDLGHESQARQYLQLLAADGQFDSQRRELLRQLEFRRLARNDVVINLQRQGGHFLLPVTLDGRTEASLLIDTGATMTVLRPQVLARAGYGPAQAQTTRRFSTANGLTDGQIFQLDEFSLGGVRLPGLSVVGLELGELQADGLLGMDVLGQFQFQIEQEQNQLRLRKK